MAQKRKEHEYIDIEFAIDFANASKEGKITANDIARFPRANVKSARAGTWFLKATDRGYWYECSECGQHWLVDSKTHRCEKTKYCPNCGVRLVE